MRLRALDGARGIAILAVMANHTGLPAARGGYLGVDLFLVLSGYLITTILVAEYVRTPSRDCVESVPSGGRVHPVVYPNIHSLLPPGCTRRRSPTRMSVAEPDPFGRHERDAGIAGCGDS
jgi:hypothetical protein